MNTPPDRDLPYQADYWNDDGGKRWLRNLDRLETMLAPLADVLMARAAPAPGDAVLDVGCGGGRLAARLAATVAPTGRVLAVDISAMLVERARRDHGAAPNLAFQLSDAGSDALGAGGYSLVFSRFGVMFFADPVAAFTHIAAAMAPGARMAFLCWQGKDRNPWMYGPAAAAFEHVPAPPPPAPDDPGPFCFGDPDRVRRILGAAGLANTGIEPLTGRLALGPVDEALDFVSTMGPAAQPLAEAEPGARGRALAAMREVLAAHAGGTGVEMPYATWVVTARRP